MVGYKRPKHFYLKRSLKKLARCVARGNFSSIAQVAMQIPALKSDIIKKVYVVVKKEIQAMCADSSLSIY